MELYQLKSFVVLAEEGSLRPAAERLYVSQPTLSGHIKALESEFGFELFERSHKGMLLTPEGEQFHTHALRILQEAREAKNVVESLRGEVNGTVRLGIINDGRDLLLDKTIVHLAQTHPQLQVDITSSNSGLVIKALLDQTFDVGFIEGERAAPELTKRAVTKSYPVIVYPPEWDDLKSDSWDNFQNHPWSFVSEACTYYYMIHKEVSDRSLKMDWKYTVDHNSTTMSLIEQGLAMGVLDRSLAEPAEKEGKLCIWPHYRPEMIIYLAWMSNRATEKLISTYILAAESIFKAK